MPRQPHGRPHLKMKISLRGTDPIIWRNVLVPGAMPLNKLHSVIQAAMGWQDSHLHVFEINGQRYGVLDLEPEEEEADLDEYGVQVHGLLNEGDRFTYEYDFGDSWIHDIEVEAVNKIDGPAGIATCLDGARACPPENCGGTSAFADFVEIMADPAHPGHQEMVSWFGGSFDPEFFDLSETNERIRGLR
jgi:hypothetical protein